MLYASDRRFRQRPDAELLDCVLDAIIVIDSSLELTYANRAAKAYLDLAAPPSAPGATGGVGGALGATFSALRLVHPDDYETAIGALADAQRTQATQTVRLRLVLDDRVYPVEVGITDRLSHPAIRGWVVCFRDLADIVAADSALAAEVEREAFLRRLLRIQTSISRRVPVAEVMSAIVDGVADLLGEDITSLRLPDPHDPESLVLVASHGLRAGHFDDQRTIRVGEGLAGRAVAESRLIVIHLGPTDAAPSTVDSELLLDAISEGIRASMAAPIRVGQRTIGSLLVASRSTGRSYSATEQEMLQIFAEHAGLALLDAQGQEEIAAALIDPITNLPSRRVVVGRLDQALVRGRRLGKSVAALFVDLDRFKSINDACGHAIGDEVLRQIGGRLKDIVGPGDTVARFGGDEFVIVVEDVTRESLALLTRQILDRLRETILVGAREFHVDASLGVAVSFDARTAGDALIREADIAMYRAKRTGGGCFVFFEPSMQTEVEERAALDRDIRSAIDADEIDVVFQPVRDLATGEACSVEALARWSTTGRGEVPAVQFIRVAEELNLIEQLDRRVLEKACRAVKGLRSSSGKALTLNVNLSARHLERPDLVPSILATLADCGFEPQRLVVEVTETDMMRDQFLAVEQLQQLRAAGIRIAVDDFGTGYSSLAYLQRLPLDVLKIDRSFIVSMGDDPGADHLVRAVVALARAFGLRVVAEGVETCEQLDALGLLGVESGQGYLLGRPMHADDLAIGLRRGVSAKHVEVVRSGDAVAHATPRVVSSSPRSS